MIWLECEKACEPKNEFVCRGEERAQEFLREIAETDETFIVAECANCAHANFYLKEEWIAAGIEMDRRAYRKKASLDKYPCYEPHTGEYVISKEHKAETLKRMGYHAAENGVDEKYNDETTAMLKAKQDALKERKQKIAKKREALIREGVVKRPKVPAKSLR